MKNPLPWKIPGYAPAPCCTYDNFDDVLACFKKTASDLFQWFSNDGMKANSDKCHVLLSTEENLTANVLNFNINNSNKEKLQGCNHWQSFKIWKSYRNLCGKARQKLYALSRMFSYTSLDQRKLIMKSFINSQFVYSPLIWMNHSRELNNKMTRIHEGTLRITYRDKKSTFDELFKKDNVKIHINNLQVLVT